MKFDEQNRQSSSWWHGLLARALQQAGSLFYLEVFKKYERLPRSADLKSPETQAQIIREVEAVYTPAQGNLEGITEQPNIAEVVAKTADLYIERPIDIPRIVVLPKGEVTSGFHDFDLDVSSIRLQPVAMDILIQHLRTHERERLVSGDGLAEESRAENYLVRALIDFDDISYDDHADLLYKLAGQVVAHLRSYLPDEAAVRNVLQYHQQRLSDLIHAQTQTHHWERATAYETHVSKVTQMDMAPLDDPRLVALPLSSLMLLR